MTRVSVKAAPVRVVLALVLSRVKVSVDVPPSAIKAGANALLMVGCASTVSEAVPKPALVPATAPLTVEVLLV